MKSIRIESTQLTQLPAIVKGLVNKGVWFLYLAEKGERMFILQTTQEAYELKRDGTIIDIKEKKDVEHEFGQSVYFSDLPFPKSLSEVGMYHEVKKIDKEREEKAKKKKRQAIIWYRVKRNLFFSRPAMCHTAIVYKRFFKWRWVIKFEGYDIASGEKKTFWEARERLLKAWHEIDVAVSNPLCPICMQETVDLNKDDLLMQHISEFKL